MIHPATNKVPGHPISVFNNDVRNLIYSPNFILYLNNYEYSVKEISGIDIDYKYEANQSGGTEYPIFSHDYGNRDYIRINVKRAMPKKKSNLASKAIQAGLATAAKFFHGRGQNLARKTAMLGAASLDPIASLEKGPALGMIQIFSRNFSKVDASFSFLSLGAEKWTMSPELDAFSGDVIYESIDLICQGLTRMTIDWSSPSGIWNVTNVDNSMYDESELEDLERLREFSMENIAKVRERQKEKEKSKLSIDDRIARLKEDYDQLSKTYDDIVSKNQEEWKKENREVEEAKKKQIAAFEQKKEEEKQKYQEALKKAKEESMSKGEIYDDRTSEEISKQIEEDKRRENEEKASKILEDKIKIEVEKEIDRLKRIKKYNDKK